VGHRRTQADRSAETRGALIGAARALFAERGYAGAGREEIVERAGVTRGALYHHFGAKEALFRAVYEAVETDLCDALARAAAAGRDPVEQLRLGTDAFLDAAGSREVSRIVLLDAPAVLPVEERRALSEQYGLGMVRGGLAAAAAAGRLAIELSDELAIIVLAMLHEAATAIAEGADPDRMRSVVQGLLDRITRD